MTTSQQKSRDYYIKHREAILHKRKDRYYLGYRSSGQQNVVKKYRASIKGKYALYKSNAKVRGYSFDIKIDQFSSFWQKPCSYCGDSIDTIGIDRIDSSKGYTLDNLTPCCEPCNGGKMDRSREEYILRCNRVARKHSRSQPLLLVL